MAIAIIDRETLGARDTFRAVPMTRRQLLLGGASAILVAACSRDEDEPDDRADDGGGRPAVQPLPAPPIPALAGPPFTLGVASGDPDPTSVVVWTRLAPQPDAGGGMPAEDVDVVVEVARDDDFSTLAATEIVTASPAYGHSVRVIVDDLEPDTWYWYRFRAGEHTSPTGRTRTTPADGDDTALRFAFASCQDWQDGYWPAHAHLAEEELDLVVFLGDYIYEGGADPNAVRQHGGPEPTTLDGYRSRYVTYKRDAALQAAHAARPWLVVWDDHEVDNNYAGDASQDGGDPAVFLERRAAAYQAWWEHIPTRLDPPSGANLAIHRALRWGSVVSLYAIDTRQHRADQACGRRSDLGAGCPERDDPSRSMLGADQESWLADGLARSDSTWNVVANQVILSPAEVLGGDDPVFILDLWDGYPAARQRLLDLLAEASNPVVITGDIHASAVTDLHRDAGDPASPVIGTELVGTSLSSTFPPTFAGLFESAALERGALMADARHHGYVRCEVTADRFTAAYRLVESVATETSPIRTDSEWVIDAGTPGIRPLP